MSMSNQQQLPDNAFLDAKAAADYLGYASAATMATLRRRGRGPTWYKLNGSVRYLVGDLRLYLEACRRLPDEADTE